MNTQATEKGRPFRESGYRSSDFPPTRHKRPRIAFDHFKGVSKPVESSIQRSLLQQREQIARDLHDGIGSQLTHIISRLDLLAHGNVTLENQLHDLRDFTRETVKQLRETIWVLNQNEIVYGELTERIRGLLTRISTDSECPSIRLTAYGDAQTLLSPQLASSIFRITQEGVNNAIKYADCTELSVCLAIDQNSLTIQIRDNGRGFCPEEVTLGYGLLNFQKRTEELDGSLTINSSGDGTEVMAEFPLLPPIKYVK